MDFINSLLYLLWFIHGPLSVSSEERNVTHLIIDTCSIEPRVGWYLKSSPAKGSNEIALTGKNLFCETWTMAKDCWSHIALFHTIGDWELVRVLWYSNFTYAKYFWVSHRHPPKWALCRTRSYGSPCWMANIAMGPWKERIFSFLNDVISLFLLPLCALLAVFCKEPITTYWIILS